ncbi:hypothetical protein ACTHRH_13475 [Paenibacillus sp. SAFN-117]
MNLLKWEEGWPVTYAGAGFCHLPGLGASADRNSINNPLRLLGLRIRLSELLFYDIGKEPGG